MKYSYGMCGTCFDAMIHQVGQCTWPAFTPLTKMVNKKRIQHSIKQSFRRAADGPFSVQLLNWGCYISA